MHALEQEEDAEEAEVEAEEAAWWARWAWWEFIPPPPPPLAPAGPALEGNMASVLGLDELRRERTWQWKGGRDATGDGMGRDSERDGG